MGLIDFHMGQTEIGFICGSMALLYIYEMMDLKNLMTFLLWNSPSLIRLFSNKCLFYCVILTSVHSETQYLVVYKNQVNCNKIDWVIAESNTKSMTNIHNEITAHRLHSIHITLRNSPLQFVNRRAATSDNPLFTIHNLNPVSHLSSICITILVCPFNKHLLAQKCTSVREWRISPIQIFFRYDPLELLSLCVKPVSPTLCTFFLLLYFDWY